MRRAITKPRIVTRQMVEDDFACMAEFQRAVSDRECSPPSAWPVFLTLAALVAVMLSGFVFALRLAGWV